MIHIVKKEKSKFHDVDLMLCKKTYMNISGISKFDSDNDIGISGCLSFGISIHANDEFYERVYVYVTELKINVEIGEWVLFDGEPKQITSEMLNQKLHFLKIVKTNDVEIIRYNDSNDKEDLEFNGTEFIDFVNDYNKRIISVMN